MQIAARHEPAQWRQAGTLGLLVCRYSPPASCRAVGGWAEEEESVRAGACNLSAAAACCPVPHVHAAAAIPIAAAACKPRVLQHQRHLQRPSDSLVALLAAGQQAAAAGGGAGRLGGHNLVAVELVAAQQGCFGRAM